jgi:hypothetical protein
VDQLVGREDLVSHKQSFQLDMRLRLVTERNCSSRAMANNRWPVNNMRQR